jgi:iron complex outermembrane receptor protein
MKLKTIVRAIALLGVAAPLAAFSQDAAQRVEITGSSIKRIASEGALPVQIITRQDLEKQGIVTAEQMVASLSGNGNGMDNLASNSDVAAGSGRGNNGLSSANLRMQGAGSTLVLVNGRRVAPQGLNGGIVDLNSIPMGAVERVEVLKDGASAIYGTDAIGGVINFILRKNYKGVQATASTDVTQHGGGNITRASITAGFGDLDTDRFNVLASLSHIENQALRGDQRSFVNTFQSNRGLSVDTRGTPFATLFPLSSLWTAMSNKSSNGPIQPGTTVPMTGINMLNLPGGAGCNSIDGMAAYDSALWSVANGKWGCAWDTGRAAVLQQPVKNTSGAVRGTLRLGEHQVYAELTGAQVEADKSFSPSQISSSASASSLFFNLAYPSTGSSYNYVFNQLVATFPTVEANRGKPLAFRWRCMPCGNRQIDTTSDSSRLVLGAEGPLMGGWDYRAGLSSASSDTTSVLGGGYYFAKPVVAAINSGLLNPFLLAGQQQTPEALAALAAGSAQGTTLYGGKSTLLEADFNATGPLMKLPAGDVMAAVGVDLRTEKWGFNGNATDLASQAQIFNAPFDSANNLDTKKRDVRAVYTEVLVPITKNLEVTGAVRHDTYTGFGSTTNPKMSLRFTPMDTLMVRGSYSTGFRVPSFAQLFNGFTTTAYVGKDLVDPTKCSTGKVSTTLGCESITPDVITGGKPELGPEKSKQWSAGFVFEPVRGISVGADLWSIRKNGTIQFVSLSDMLANYTLFPDNFKRDAAGVLTTVDDRWVNAGETVTKGIDITANASGKVLDGRWVAALDGTYMLDKRSRLIASAPMGASEIGQFTRSGDLGLRWKHSLSGTYSQGNWSGTLTQVFRAGYKDAQLPGVANGTVTPADWVQDVKSYALYHLMVSYTGVKNLTLTCGVKNLFDTKPPFSAVYDTNTGAGSSWEPRVADPRLRSFVLAVDYKFK